VSQSADVCYEPLYLLSKAPIACDELIFDREASTGEHQVASKPISFLSDRHVSEPELGVRYSFFMSSDI